MSDLDFFQVALAAPALYDDGMALYTRVDGVWRLPHDGSAPRFYALMAAWPQSHAGQIAGLAQEISRHLAELERRNATILAQQRELAELRQQLADVQQQQRDAPLDTVAEPWRCATAFCQATEPSVTQPAYCLAHAAQRNSAPAAEAPAQQHRCLHCDRAFESVRALTIHSKRAHSSAPPPALPSPYTPPEPPVRVFVCARCGSSAHAPSVADATLCIRCVAKPATSTAPAPLAA